MTSPDQKTPPARRKPSRRKRENARETSRVQIVLGWAAFGLVAWTVLRNGGVAPLIWHVMCLVTLLLFAVQVVLDFRHGLPRAARPALALWVPFFAVLAWLLIQGITGLPPGLVHPFWDVAPEGAMPTISAHPDAGAPVVMRLTCYALLFWIVMRSAAAAKHGALAYIRGIAVFATALALYGLVSKATGYNVLLNSDESAQALRASFWYRNAYAIFAVFGILANVTAYVQAVSGSMGRDGIVAVRDFLEAFFSGGWLFAFGALVGLAALAMTLSRGGAVAGVVGIVVLVWALRRGEGKVSLAALAIPVVLVVFVALFMTSGVIDRIDLIDQEARPDIFRQTIAGALDRPLLGHGAGAYADAFRPYAPLSQAAYSWDKAHNSYLENAFEFGLPAAALFYLVLAMIGWRLLAGVRTRRRHQGTSAFALACFAAAAVHALVDFSLQIPAIAALFAMILGLGWGQSFPTRDRSGSGRTRVSGRR